MLDGTRASAHPLTAAEAWAFVTDWLEAEPAWIPTPTTRHARVLERLVVEGDLRGNLIPDAHLAALAIEHEVGVCSADSDFARFPGLSTGATLSAPLPPGKVRPAGKARLSRLPGASRRILAGVSPNI